MRFEYMNSIAQDEFVISWERSLDPDAFYIFLNGSYGDIFTFLSMFLNFTQKVDQKIYIYCENRWTPLVRRFLKDRASIIVVENFWSLNNALAQRFSNALGQIKPGRIFMSCVTCHPNLPELICLNFLDHADCYRYLLNLSKGAGYVEPPDSSVYRDKAHQHLGEIARSNKKKALLSFSTNSNVEQPIGFIMAVLEVLVNSGYATAYNSTDARAEYSALQLMGAMPVTIPPEMPGEIIDVFDVFISAYNGLSGNAMLCSKTAKLIIVVPNIIETKSNDWSMPHSKQSLDFQHKAYRVDSTRVNYLIVENDKFKLTSSSIEPRSLFASELQFIEGLL